MTVLDIGLVNNMPNGALAATERQFRTLLHEAADDRVSVRLTLHALPGVPRTALGCHDMDSYSSTAELRGRSLDGLIVTGTEPRAANLQDEPYWADLTWLVEWAGQNTCSTVWSCLAAHAAVLHLDGIHRCRLAEKRFGIFECVRVSEHLLTAGLPERARISHSRWNDLREEELTAAGYTVLRRLEVGGVDTFVKRGTSLFVFLQGHPEYEADTLLSEYHRDMKRFLSPGSAARPSLPRGCADPSCPPANVWRSDAVRLYRNWLSYLAERKGRPLQSVHGRA